MKYIEAIIIGIIQGFTEFLPISSSGHLEIGKALFGNEAVGQESLFLTLVLHFATALSTMVVFKNEIREILKGLLDFKINDHTQFSIKIIISMIPAILVGLFFQNQIEALFSKNLVLVGVMLLFTAMILFLADLASDTQKKNNLLKCICIRNCASDSYSSRNIKKRFNDCKCCTFRD